MQSCTENSPEAMAQLLTELMAADDRIDNAGIKVLDVLDAHARIGITLPRLADVLRNHSEDIDESQRARCRGGALEKHAWTGGRRRRQLPGADRLRGTGCQCLVERVGSVWWNRSLPARLAVPGKTRGYVPQGLLPRSPARGETSWELARTG